MKYTVKSAIAIGLAMILTFIGVVPVLADGETTEALDPYVSQVSVQMLNAEDVAEDIQDGSSISVNDGLVLRYNLVTLEDGVSNPQGKIYDVTIPQYLKCTNTTLNHTITDVGTVYYDATANEGAGGVKIQFEPDLNLDESLIQDTWFEFMHH